MICDDLSEDEIYQAFLIYASLHGMSTREDVVRERISAYLERSIPDELIDDAILAYTEDCIVAPPDIVLNKWGSSRFFELVFSADEVARHQTCEVWFENGCRFVDNQSSPELVHFWTIIDRDDNAVSLEPGTRLSLKFDNDHVAAVHRTRGVIGRLPEALSNSLRQQPLRNRKHLVLIDKLPSEENASERQAWQAELDSGTYNHPGKALAISADPRLSTDAIVKYAAAAYDAARNKC